MEKQLYALNLNEENRILSVTYDKYAPALQPRVTELPTNEDGTSANVVDYLYVDGEYVYDPLPEPEMPEPEPTTEDILNTLLGMGV